MIIKKIQSAFSLIEIMVGVLIVSIVLIGGFKALSSVTIGKAKLIQKTDIQKESLYFTQKLFEMIKKGGTLDYEEYFNRKVIGNSSYSSGHYDIDSGFGNYGIGGVLGSSNYGEKFYYCRSGDGLSEKMGTGGCYDNNLNSSGALMNGQQRYGQYSFQYIDYNSNYDDDDGLFGDEDGNLKIIGDDDDEYIGDGPLVFDNGDELAELYLISGDKKTRTYFRWNINQDTYGPGGASNVCSQVGASNSYTGSCIGTIEYLKMDGKDYGMNDHVVGGGGITENDGLIDTWLIDDDFIGGGDIAGSNSLNWVRLFPESINVSDFKILAFPGKDLSYAWKNDNKSVNISPYVVLKLKLKPSWISRRKIHGDGQELDFSMTINLSEIYSQ